MRFVFYTLHDGASENLQLHRNSKALAVLIQTLHEKNLLDDADVDRILFEVIH